LGSTTPVLRLMIRQLNCFAVVERGCAMNSVMRERAWSAPARSARGSKMRPGQMDSYHALVRSTHNCRAQSVKGGLGTGGSLGVQGGSTPNSPSSARLA